MYRHNIVNQHFQRPKTLRLNKANDQLGINRIDFIKDNQRKQLILLVTGNQMVYSELYAFLKGAKLILEAPIPFHSNDIPVRTHLVGEEMLHEFLDDDQLIGFSEISLNPGFHYNVLSYNVLNPGLIKIVLSYRQQQNHKQSNQIN